MAMAASNRISASSVFLLIRFRLSSAILYGEKYSLVDPAEPSSPYPWAGP
jgi:hypothetical protein